MAPEQTIGANTIDAMRSGIFLGYVSMIEGLVSRVKKELKKKPTVVATGGLAKIYADSIKEIDVVDLDITTYGLFLLHSKLKGE
jgi:type III pantothenate kinase